MLVAGERACALVGSLGNPLDRQTEKRPALCQLNPLYQLTPIAFEARHAITSSAEPLNTTRCCFFSS